MSIRDETATFAIAQAIRDSHCDRKGADHQCVGEVTIKRGEVCLNCPLCGKGEQIPHWNDRHAKALRRIFDAAGIDWRCLEFEAQRRAVEQYGKETRGWQ